MDKQIQTFRNFHVVPVSAKVRSTFWLEGPRSSSNLSFFFLSLITRFLVLFYFFSKSFDYQQKQTKLYRVY